jgi:sulfur carrier protein ThiS
MRKILGTSCSIVIALAGCAGPGPEVADGSAPAAPEMAETTPETAPQQAVAEKPAETMPAPAVNTVPPAGATSAVKLTTDTAIPTRDGKAHRWELRAFKDNRIEVFMDGQPVPADHVVRKGNHVAVVDESGKVIERLDMPPTWTPQHGDPAAAPAGYRLADGTQLTPPKAMLGGRLEAVPAGTLAHMHAEHTEATGSKCTYVANVIPDLPLAKAGIMAHDVIVMVNGSNDASPEAIRAIVRAAAPGDTITITVVRAGQLRDAFVTLAAWEPKHMVRAVGEVNQVAPAMASGEPARAPAPLPVAAVQPAPAPAPTPAPAPEPKPTPAPVAQQAPAAAPSDPATQDELTKARARIAELERRVQADEAVRKAIRPQPAPQPSATPGPARTPPAP